MLKSEELLNKLEEVKNEIKTLQVENKVEEAHTKLSEIENLKKEIEVAKAIENEEMEDIQNKIETRKDDVKVENIQDKEMKVFENYLRNRGVVQDSMTAGGNGAIIPNTISSKIIEKVKEISPIFSKCTVFHEGGTLTFAKEDSIPTTAYVNEKTVIPDSDATFTTITLDSYLVSALTKISESLIASASFDIVSYVTNAIAKSIAQFLEKELLVGTSGKMEGALATTNKAVSLGATVAIDDLIATQMLVPSGLQGNCCWIMNPSTLMALRKMKDTTGALIMGSAVDGFGYTLLGKPVYLSENVAEVGASKDVALYGDLSGLYVKFAKEINTKVLMERYADSNEIGVKANFIVDSKIVETQKLAKLTMKA